MKNKQFVRTKYEFLHQLDLDDDVISRLSLHLDRTLSGSKTVIVAPIAETLSPDNILKGWDNIVAAKKEVLNKNLHALEVLNRSKFGPRSIAIPWIERRPGVVEYFGDSPSNLSYKLELLRTGPDPRLRPLSINNAIKLLKNNTNSGLPYYRRKGLVKDDYSENNNSLLNREDPCIMFTRTQEAKKTRPVWGYPMADTIEEMCFYAPLLDHQKKLKWRAALNGPEAVDQAIIDLISSQASDEKLVSIDFSAYDTSVKSELQKFSFDYIKMLFQNPTYPRIDKIASRFNTIGLITPDGVMSGEHGVPSGSTFTNEVDSIAQYLCAKSIGISDDKLNIQGDDGAYCVKDPDRLKETFRSFGLNVNDEKSYISDDYIIYLQGLYDKFYINQGVVGGIYPTYRALNRIVYPERFDDFSVDKISGSDYFSIRTIAILENCKHHPLFESLVEYIYKLDKYNLVYTGKGLNKYIERIIKSKGSGDFLVNQYSDNLTGINNFETVKLLKKLRTLG